MKFIDYGLGILNSDLLGAANDEAFDLSEIYAALAGDGRLAGFEATKRFYEIGTPSGLAVADGHLKGKLLI
jgi:NDP-sugar pyrophosphorylase family protein